MVCIAHDDGLDTRLVTSVSQYAFRAEDVFLEITDNCSTPFVVIHHRVAVADHEQHPEIPADRSVLERDAYKAHIIDTLRHRGYVDIENMAAELEKRFGGRFRYRHFMQAAAVVRSYCQNGGADLTGGTGLSEDSTDLRLVGAG